MSSEFEKCLVLDNRLHCTDKLNYAVMKGAQNITYSQFNAVSATNNQMNFNVQMPSQETILSRDINLEAQITLTIDVPVVPAGTPVNPMSRAIKLMYGKTDAFAPFPLHQLIQTQTCTLNKKIYNSKYKGFITSTSKNASTI